MGKTRDISTKGVFFRADQALPKGLDVELSMDWPFRLNGLCLLQVKIAPGHIHRRPGSSTRIHVAIRMALNIAENPGASPAREDRECHRLRMKLAPNRIESVA